MSGTNPFRRKDIGKQNSETPLERSNPISHRTDAHVTPINTDIPRTTKTKTSKTVRIISPHSASSEQDKSGEESILLRSRVSSFPPPKPVSPESSADEALDDPFTAGSDEGKLALQGDKGRQYSSSDVDFGDVDAPTIPMNPFKRTLASITRMDGASAVDKEQPIAESAGQKPQYDVEDFKKLLLTGKKPPTDIAATSPNVAFKSQPFLGDNNSNADTSSLSRQSLSETASALHSESPRTSQDLSISDDERQRLMGTIQLQGDKLKPSTPRHRHGKLVKSNAPQTVSFEDPTLSLSSTEINYPTSPGGYNSLLSREIDRTQPSRHTQEQASILNPPRSNTQGDTFEADASHYSQKNPPPAPPPRRQGQTRSRSFISELNRSSSIREEGRSDSDNLSQHPPSNNSKPVPPAPRRAATLRHDSSSSFPTTTSMATSPDQSSLSTKPLPAPPTQSPSITASKRPVATSPHASSPSSAPPPPPPRRRGSSQSSYTTSSLSGDYRHLMNQRPRGDSGASSISQLQMSPPSEASTQQQRTEKKDPLADLSALQREVDEYRGKIGR